MTALHIAAENGNLAMVKLLLEFNADVNAPAGENVLISDYTPNSGETPLHVAAAYGNTEIVACLLKAGANIEATAVFREEEGYTPLHFSTHNPEIVELLLTAGANRMARTGDGHTALDFATQHQRKPAIQLLLKYSHKKDLSH